jgi:hypothetical protein
MDDPIMAITRHLESTDDPTLLVLRTHLLVEERLRDIINRICRAPSEVRSGRLSFYQVLYLCRAIIGRHDEPAWGFVERLNEVRNRMAHQLDPGNLDELIGSVVDKLEWSHHRHPDKAAERFRQAAVYVCGYFDSMRGSARLREAYGPEIQLRMTAGRKRRRRRRGE